MVIVILAVLGLLAIVVILCSNISLLTHHCDVSDGLLVKIESVWCNGNANQYSAGTGPITY